MSFGLFNINRVRYIFKCREIPRKEGSGFLDSLYELEFFFSHVCKIRGVTENARTQQETMLYNVACCYSNFLIQESKPRRKSTERGIDFCFPSIFWVPVHGDEYRWRQYVNIRINSHQNSNTKFINARWINNLTAYHVEIIKTTEKNSNEPYHRRGFLREPHPTPPQISQLLLP